MTNFSGYEDRLLAMLRIPRFLVYCVFIGAIGSSAIHLSYKNGSGNNQLAALYGFALCALLFLLFFLGLRLSKRVKDFFMKKGKNHEKMNTRLRQPITIWISLTALTILLIAFLTKIKNDSNQAELTTPGAAAPSVVSL